MVDVPSQLKPISHFLKIAYEHELNNRDLVVAYWCRFHAVQTALGIDKSSPEAKQCLFQLMDHLEKMKKDMAGNEAITNEQVAQAHIENYALKLFSFADKKDRNSEFDKNTIKSFYTAGILFDILTCFNEELSEDIEKIRKYAKWRAAYIHNCLKTGETPIPGELVDDESNSENPNLGWVVPPSDHPNYPSSSGSGYNEGPSTSYFDPNSINRPSNDSTYNMPQQPQSKPFIPSPSEPAVNSFNPSTPSSATTTSTTISLDAIGKAQKYCKWAGNALNFDDVSTAIENLKKALNLLEKGTEQ